MVRDDRVRGFLVGFLLLLPWTVLMASADVEAEDSMFTAFPRDAFTEDLDNSSTTAATANESIPITKPTNWTDVTEVSNHTTHHLATGTPNGTLHTHHVSNETSSVKGEAPSNAGLYITIALFTIIGMLILAIIFIVCNDVKTREEEAQRALARKQQRSTKY